MSYSPYDLQDYVEEQLTSIGLLPPDVEHSYDDIWAAFYQLVEKYQALIKENNASATNQPRAG